MSLQDSTRFDLIIEDGGESGLGEGMKCGVCGDEKGVK